MTSEEKQAIRDRNMQAHRAIADRLEAAHGKRWADAWLSLVVSRGKRCGCLKLHKPGSRAHNGRAAVLWEAWDHVRGQASAYSLGVGPACMSVHGLMYSLWACRDDDTQGAYETAVDAIVDIVLKKKGK